MLDLKRLTPLESEWEEIEQSYRIARYMAPLNRDEERQKLFDAYSQENAYEPQFVYTDPPDYPVSAIRGFMAKLRPEHSPLEGLYYEKARNALLEIEAVQTHHPGVITAASALENGLPDAALLAEARRILRETAAEETLEPEDIPAEQAAESMQTVINKAGIQEWKAIVFEPMSAGMSVNRLDKELKIRKGDFCSQSDLQRLVVHEIGVHILRYENGLQQPIRLFQGSFPSCTSTEEGLAVYSERRAGLLKNVTLRKYAGRVVAANAALSQPFSRVFSRLVDDLGTDEAFNIVTRAKRGFTDTGQPGAHVKDLVYLKGYLDVTAHLAQRPEDYSLLFLGKFGLQHLALVREMLAEGMISLPAYLPEHLMP